MGERERGEQVNYDDPLSGTRGGQIHNLTPEQRSMAERRCGEADGLLQALNEKRTWFTAFQLNTFPTGLDELVRVGVLTKHKSQNHDGHYYKPTALTRPWCLTALALRDERVAALKERAEGG